MASVVFQDLAKVFPGGHAAAVAGVSLSVGDGEFLAVLGPSGSGKSTLLRLIAGLDSPSAGRVVLGGRNMAGVAPSARDVAMVFQNQMPMPHLSVFDNLAFGLRARKAGRAEVESRVGEVAAMLGLSDKLGRKPAELSGGERQRVALGRALARRPAVLLLDEPFSNLDAPLRASLRDELAAAHRRFGTTTLLVTHDQAEALALGDRVAVMDQGELAQVGTPRDVYDRPANRFVGGFVGDPPMNFLLLPEGAEGPLTPPTSLEGGRRAFLVGIRPESLVTDGPPHAGISAVVKRVEPRGPDQILTLAIGDQEAKARSSARLELRVGREITVNIAPGSVAWFDPETGRRCD